MLLVSAAATETDTSPFIDVPEAARLAGMSVSNIRRRCATDGFAIRPGGCGPWRIRRELFERWLAGEVLK